MICFFDPAHGQGTTSVMWQPQWGVARPIEVCHFCAQRIQTTQPPFYQPSQTYSQQGYPQQGYPQAYEGQAYQGQPPHQGHSTGALIGAGAAGLVGGMILEGMLDDDDEERGYDRGYDRGFDEGEDFGDFGGDGGFF